MFEELGKLLNVMYWSWFAMFPFAIWKLIDIALWVFKNVHIGIR